MRLFKSKDPLLTAVNKVADPDWTASGEKYFWKKHYRGKELPVLMQFERNEEERAYYYCGTYAILHDTERFGALYLVLKRIEHPEAEELAEQEMSARDFFFEFDALGELPGTLNGISVKDGTVQNKYPVGAAFVAEYSPTGFGRLELKAPSSAANSGVLEEYNKKVK